MGLTKKRAAIFPGQLCLFYGQLVLVVALRSGYRHTWWVLFNGKWNGLRWAFSAELEET